MKNKILLIIGIILALAVVIVIAILAGTGGLFQGALYNLRPIYTSCHIEGNKSTGEAFVSDNLDDCEHFHEKLQNNPPFLDNGQYTISAKYTDKKLPANLIPISIKNHQLSCTYNESGYQPVVNIINPNDQLSSETVKSTDEIPVGSEGVIARINYSKDNQVYAYDTNICESAFQTTVYDANKVELGTAKLDTNGFINSRPLVNEVLITNAPYYLEKGGTTIKLFTPGNVYAILNAAPDLTFKFTIACSSNFPKATIPSVVTDSDTSLLFQGINEQFFNTCGSKLYLSFQNANRADDIQVLNQIKFTPVDNNSVSYDLKLADLGSINIKNTKFPFTYTVNLHLRERSDSTDVQTLGSGVLTISNYTPIDYAAIANGGITPVEPIIPPIIPLIIAPDIIPPVTEPVILTPPKVRYIPEVITLPPSDTAPLAPAVAPVSPALTEVVPTVAPVVAPADALIVAPVVTPVAQP